MFESIEILSIIKEVTGEQGTQVAQNTRFYDFKREIVNFEESEDSIDRFMKYKAIGCREAGNSERDFAHEEIECIYQENKGRIRVPKGEADSSELLLSIMKKLYSEEVMKCCPSCDTFNSAVTTLLKTNISGSSTRSARQIIKLYTMDPNTFKKSLKEAIPFFDFAYTIGNFIPVPSGFNVRKGFSKLTNDYSDLTLKIIYEYYSSGKDEHLLLKFLTKKQVQASREWLDIFGTWEKFVAQNYLQDFVDANNIPLELWDGHFSGNVRPTHEEALIYFHNAAKRIALRGERMLKILGDTL